MSVTTDHVIVFRDFCVQTLSIYMHRRILFEAGDATTRILSDTAPILFGDLAAALRDMVILNVCKMTDPEVTGRRENLTLEFLVKQSDRLVDQAEAAHVAALSDAIHSFRAIILPARDKLISHLDRATVIGDKWMSPASSDLWHSFWVDLRDLLQIYDRLYVDPDGLFDLLDVSMISDATSLTNALMNYAAYVDAAATRFV